MPDASSSQSPQPERDPFADDPLDEFLNQERFRKGPREPGTSSGCLGTVFELIGTVVLGILR